MIEKSKLYYTSTILYGLVGFIGVIFLIYSIMNKNLILLIVSALVIYVAFDNVTCKSRKERYFEK